jgi:hypothetical protein
MIKDFKLYLINESINTNDLKEYVKYLIDEYAKINPNWEDSGMYYNLKQFYEEGKIKGIVSKNTKTSIKVEVICLLKNEIRVFCEINKINDDIDTFRDFLLRQNSPEEYKIKKSIQKYNL